MKAHRVVVVVLALSVATGALAPVAQAQQPSPQPPLMQEQIKSGPGVDEVVVSDQVRAAVVNVFRVPGKAFTCLLGGALALGVLGGSFGRLDRAANSVFDEGCSGKWVLTPADMRREPEVSQAFDWETHRFDWESR
jgi:hypothetical protein